MSNVPQQSGWLAAPTVLMWIITAVSFLVLFVEYRRV